MPDLKISEDGCLKVSETRKMENQVLNSISGPSGSCSPKHCPTPSCCPSGSGPSGSGPTQQQCCPKIKVCDSRWSWLGILILILVDAIVFWWLIFFSVAPSWVRNPNTNTIDTNKVLLAALIAGFITLLFIGIVYLIIKNSECCA